MAQEVSARIRITARSVAQEQSEGDARHAFWSIARRSRTDNAGQDISDAQFESKLRREFGPSLQQVLFSNARNDCRRFQEIAFESDRFFLRSPSLDKYPIDWITLLQSRQDALFQVTGYRDLLQRSAIAATLRFGIQDIRYSSLTFSLVVNEFNKLLEYLDTDAANLGPLLSPFIADAYSELFGSDASGELNWEISTQAIPERPAVVSKSHLSTEVSGAPNREQSENKHDQKGRWLWLIANSSLLIPVVLALVVAYQIVHEVQSARKADREALQAISEQQRDVIKQERDFQKASAEKQTELLRDAREHERSLLELLLRTRQPSSH